MKEFKCPECGEEWNRIHGHALSLVDSSYCESFNFGKGCNKKAHCKAYQANKEG